MIKLLKVHQLGFLEQVKHKNWLVMLLNQMQSDKHQNKHMLDTVIVIAIKDKEINMNYSYYEIKSYVLQPIELEDDELNFKVEILTHHNSNSVQGQLWRLETYRVQPSFVSDMQADESIYVQDSHTIPDLQNQVFNNEEICLQFIISELEKLFSHSK